MGAGDSGITWNWFFTGISHQGILVIAHHRRLLQGLNTTCEPHIFLLKTCPQPCIDQHRHHSKALFHPGMQQKIILLVSQRNFWQLSRDRNLHWVCHAPWQPLQNHPLGHLGRVSNAMVSRGNAGWTSKNGRPYLCQNCWRWPPAEQTGKWSLLNRPSCPPNDPFISGGELQLQSEDSSRIHVFLKLMFAMHLYASKVTKW